MAPKLHAFAGDARAQKVLIAAQLAGVDVEVVVSDDAKKLSALSPSGKVPVLVTEQGTLTQSNAIARFLVGDKLFGSSAFEAAEVNQWVDFCLNEVEVQAMVWVYPVLGLMANEPSVTDKAKTDLKKSIMMLEKHLRTRTFVVGESLTYADVALATALLLPFKLVYPEKTRKAFPCVIRWFTTCVNQPAFRKVIGAVKLAEKELKAPASAPAAAAAAPKAAKKAAAPKKEAAAAPAAPAKKPKNPLDALPKSKLNLDTWKKTYSNPAGDDFYGTMPWFWENFDPEGYSLYLCKYKFNEENKVPFMVSNLVGGFIQRCDEIRKYAFGTMQIIGTQGESIEVVGAWLFRGPSEKPILDCNPDAEYYEWIKVDHTDKAKQQEVADLWCADESIYGKPVMDGKVFK